MIRPSVAAIAALGSLFHQAVADVDCNGNITVYDSSELKEVRESCKTIEGELRLGSNWTTGNANLDGIEVIKGDLDLFNCYTFGPRGSEKCVTDGDGEGFNVTSSTLEEVHGEVTLGEQRSIEQIRFPELRSVQGSFSLYDEGTLTHLDISKLAEVSRLNIWGATQLKRIKSNGIQNFTDYERPGSGSDNAIRLYETDNLESVGDLLAGSQKQSNESLPLEIQVGIAIESARELEDFTVAGTNFTTLRVENPAIIQLGNGETENMYIETVQVHIGTKLKRDDKLQNLTVGKVQFLGGHNPRDASEDIELPFDQVSDLVIRAGASAEEPLFRHFSLPSRAEKWGPMNLTVQLERTEFQFEDEDGNDLWHWPEEIGDLWLSGKFGEELIDSFMRAKTSVSGDMFLISKSDGLDCSAVWDRVNWRVDGKFDCSSYDAGYDDAAAGNGRIHVLGLIGLSGFAGLVLAV